MPDEQTYGFNRDDAQSLIQGIGALETWFPEIKPRGGGGGGGGGGGACACTCITNGDLEYDGVTTTTQWSVTLAAIIERQTNGYITLPAGTYTLTWVPASSYWYLDIGSFLSATYNNGIDATADSTIDGDITFWKNTSSKTKLTLCFTGTVPAYSGS